MKFKATIEIEDIINETDFSADAIDVERKLRYKNVKESLQLILEELLGDEFPTVKVKQVKIDWDSNTDYKK